MGELLKLRKKKKRVKFDCERNNGLLKLKKEKSMRKMVRWWV